MKKTVLSSVVALAAAAATAGVLTFAGGADAGAPAGAPGQPTTASAAKPARATKPVPAAKPAPATTAASRPVRQVEALDLANADVSYRKKGSTVTVTSKGVTVATITLTSAKYTSSSGDVEFTVDAKRPIDLDRQMFILYDAQGENSASQTSVVRFATGRHTLNLAFRDTGEPEAIGWAPSNGDALWVR